ncbi:hypothetical protein [Singulisphaera acidiphila]|uniref:Uncharacterized protein n=1 Tax=Singulisphaera acidiphila (strain ATCC BAA-1392 / DSM 18658 / VKM B-2454 / MOB10) TaxID=886293 RepID=L0DG47_SINAD|nr:hypothetical protein [Singulisphaera acidiphila]AGA28237.1 hypothetical protein Sinac_4014 [Singulisphaera acidiphila DSM 18658]
MFVTPRMDRPDALARRSRPARRLEVERLEARTALSGGLAAMDLNQAKVEPALVNIVAAIWTAQRAGVDVSADAILAASRTGMLKSPYVDDFVKIYSSLLPLASESLTGLAGAMAVLGQAYQAGVPISVLLDNTASAIGSPLADIPPEVIPMGVAAAVAAQKAGVALPPMVAGFNGTVAGSQIGAWVSAAIGQLSALTGGGGSTSNASAAPPFLITLGEFVLSNIDNIYLNSMKYRENASAPMGPRPDGTASNGLASIFNLMMAMIRESQDNGWGSVDGMSSVVVGGSGPVLTRGLASWSDELRSSVGNPDELFPLGSPEEPFSLGHSDESVPLGNLDAPVPTASITAGEIPLDIVLSDLGLPTQGVSIGLEQMAELIALEDSSLALVGTLWTVPSDSRAEPAHERDPSDEQAEPAMSSALPPSSVFVLGLDEAFERSRDACGPIFSDRAADLGEERLEGRCPIIPTATRIQWPDEDEGVSPDVGATAVAGSTLSLEGPSQAGLSAGEELDALIERGVQSVLAASASALIVGWFWVRRQRRRLAGIGRTDPHRGVGEHSPEESP